MRQTQFAKLTSGGSLALLGILAATLAGTVLLHRVKRVVQTARRLESGDLTARTGIRHGKGEIEELAHAFDSLAATLERRAREAEIATERAVFLARCSALLSASPDSEAALQTVARLAVSSLGACCIIDVLSDDGRIQRLVTAHADPLKDVLMAELARFPPDFEHPGGLSRVLRTGDLVYLPEIPDTFLDELAHTPEHREILGQLGFVSLILAPLAARGRVVGAMTLAVSESAPRFSSADIDLAQKLADHIGLAIDDARCHREVPEGRFRETDE